jgi:DNA primase catalytic core
LGLYITDLDEVISTLRARLEDYLTITGHRQSGDKKFKCFVHDDTDPSMHLNPKTNNETAHCFSCGETVDIFSAASIIQGLPTSGAGWVTETIPAIAKLLNIDISLGEPSQTQVVKNTYYALARDIADILSHPLNTNMQYMEERRWINPFEDCYTISFSVLIEKLINKGWDEQFILSSNLIALGTEEKHSFKIIDVDRVTFIIRERTGKPCAFSSRNLSTSASWKYIHSGESPIFQKKDILSGLDLALKVARREGLYIVEGDSDRFSVLANGHQNVAACVGTALTASHLNTIKHIGINDVYLCLDWDDAGVTATERILHTLSTNKITGLNVYIVDGPGGFKDIDEYLKAGNNLTSLQLLDAFQWTLARTDLKDLDSVMDKIIPIIAASPSAMKRDELARLLGAAINVSPASILIDVERIRNRDVEQLRTRLTASADKYVASVEADPTNIIAALAVHEKEINEIDAEYGRSSIGVNYQLARFDAIQDRKISNEIDISTFNFTTYSDFKKVMSEGLPLAMGTLIIFGGRANAAKTATAFALAFDALVHDPEVTVIAHLTDDNYLQVEPRFISTVSFLNSKTQKLSVGAAAAPNSAFVTNEQKMLYAKASELFRNYIAEERLIILDAEDGSTTSILEKTVKYARRKYPERKILVVSDGIHNYSDFGGMEQTPRITKIVDILKRLATKYACCVFATCEYRKNMPLDTTKLKFPVNDDLADSRAIMFRASAIIHVYNDLNDRGDAAEIFHTNPAKPGEVAPRLLLIFGKNKITSFKDKLTMDLDPDTVTLKQISTRQAAQALDEVMNGGSKISNGKLIINTDYEEDDEAL